MLMDMLICEQAGTSGQPRDICLQRQILGHTSWSRLSQHKAAKAVVKQTNRHLVWVDLLSVSHSTAADLCRCLQDVPKVTRYLKYDYVIFSNNCIFYAGILLGHVAMISPWFCLFYCSNLRYSKLHKSLLNFGLVTARQRDVNSPAWHLLVDAVTSSWHAPEREIRA